MVMMKIYLWQWYGNESNETDIDVHLNYYVSNSIVNMIMLRYNKNDNDNCYHYDDTISIKTLTVILKFTMSSISCKGIYTK